MSTNTERQRAFKQRQIDAGLVQVNVWLPVAAAAEVVQAAELIRKYPHLRVARLADIQTGRLCGLRAPKSAT